MKTAGSLFSKILGFPRALITVHGFDIFQKIIIKGEI